MAIFPAEVEERQLSPATAPQAMLVLFPARPRLGEEVPGDIRNSLRRISKPSGLFLPCSPAFKEAETRMASHREISHLLPPP